MSESEEEDEEWDKPQEVKGDHIVEKSLSLRAEVTKPMRENICSTDHRRVIIHIDIDCFYAQVEMVRDPSLKGKPLGIQQKYILVTSNYVARSLGVKKMSTIKEAKEACPQMIIRNGEDLTHYREMSYKITETIHKYSRLVERLGFDENFVDVTELVNTYPWADMHNQPPPEFVYSDTTEKCECGCHNRLLIGAHIAADIRRTLLKELDITGCAGIAHNKLLAKMVGEVHKPNQQTLMFPCHIEELLKNRCMLRKIPGIGSSTCKKLAEIGVETIHEFRDLPVSTLENCVGMNNAQWMKDLCYGIDPSPVHPTGPPQSISDEDSFRGCKDMDNVKKRLSGLIASLVKRLHGDGRVPQTFRLSMRRLTDEGHWTNRESRQCPIPSHVFSRFYTTDDTESCNSWFLQMALELFRKMVDAKKPFHITLLNVCFTKLQEQHKTQPASSITSFLQRGTPGKGTTTSLADVAVSPKETDAGTSKAQPKKKRSSLETFFKKVSPVKLSTPLTTESSRKVSPTVAIDSKKRTTDSPPAEAHENSPKRQKTQEKPDFVAKNNIDRDVFSQLPPEIQKEIMEQNSEITSRCNNTGKSRINNERFDICESSTSTCHKGGELSELRSKCVDTDNPPVSLPSNTRIFAENSHTGYSKADANHKDVISVKDEPPGSSKLYTESKISGSATPHQRLETVNSSQEFIPPDIDPVVFKELPQEIKEELVRSWKAKQEFSFSPANKTKIDRVKKQTLFKYFKKK